MYIVWVYFKIVGTRGYVGGLWTTGERLHGERAGASQQTTVSSL